MSSDSDSEDTDGEDTAREDTARPHSVRTARSFVRAFVATSYLLGRRRQGLSAQVLFSDPVARTALTEIARELSHPTRERRARILAAEVGRLIRSLAAQRLR